MSKNSDKENKVADYYDASSVDYHLQYERDTLSDTTQPYPANYFRMQMLLNSFIRHDVKRVLEVGVGEGTPLSGLLKAGLDVSGVDISKEMVRAAKANISKFGGNEDQIIWGDIQSPSTYSNILSKGKFDGVIAMGVMPHIRNDEFVLNNIKAMLAPGGRVFIEFRNSLLSLFSFNRFTHDFIMDGLLEGVAPELRDTTSKYLKKNLEMDKPSFRTTHEKDDEVVGYDAILSKYHNPLEITELFEKVGFSSIETHWYHYHPTMPHLADKNSALFRDEAMKMEHNNSKWKGMFLCSAFVVEAAINGQN